MKTTTVKRLGSAALCALGMLSVGLFTPPLQAGDAKPDASKLTLQRIFSGEFAGEAMGAVQWLGKQGGYAVREATGKGKAGSDIVRYDPESGKKEVIVSAAHLTPPGGNSQLSIEDFSFAPNEGFVLIFTNSKRVWRHNDLGDYWLYDITSQKLHKLGGDKVKPQSLQFAKFSPDSKKIAYVKDKNVCVEDIATQKVIQLTERKTTDIINGTFDWVYEEELDLRDGMRWSPDSNYIAFWRLDTSEVKDYHLINNTAELYPRIKTFKYPLVGEVNSACRVCVVGIDGQKPAEWLVVPGDPRNHYIARMTWAPKVKGEDHATLTLQQLNRLQNTNKVYFVRVFKGGNSESPVPQLPEIVLTETDKAWVDVRQSPTEWFDGGKQFLWISERDGWRHAYAVSRDGKQQKLITPGDFDVIGVVRVDAKGGWMYYYASPENPTQRYLYRSKLDGSKAEKLTPDDLKGTNGYDISPDGKWAIHTYSNFHTPPVTSLIQLPEHKVVRVLKENKKLQETLKKVKYRPGEFFRVDIGDGIELDAWCIKPPDFDASKKYPVLFHVYGEPAGQTVLDRWGGQNYLWHQMLAQHGYLVMSVDNRGTPSPRGREFRKIIYRQLGAIAPQDQAKAVQAIARKWSWVDAERVGIWGWSGGGAMTLHALFRFPNVYKTGMAIAAVTNERFYDSIYSERYMGLPGDNVKGYRECSPINFASQLKGNLLVVHGTGDDNVHYANAEALFNELIAHNKQFTMMAYPNRSHSISEGKGTRLHLFTMLTNYLEKNLPAGPATEKKEANGKAVGASVIEQGGEKKDKLKEMQKERAKAANTVFQYLRLQFAPGPMPKGESSVTFVTRLFQAERAELHARLDLCETKAERIKVYTDLIADIEPIVQILKKRLEQQAPDSDPGYYMGLDHLLELKVGLEKEKQKK